MIWHAHEMIYGYSLAVIAGFLLTAIKNWTGLQTLNGYPLGLLFLLWASARFLPLFGDSVSIEMIAFVDLLFGACLTIAAAYPILQVKLWRNVGIVLILLLLLTGNIIFYLGVLGIVPEGIHWGLYFGLYLILTLIFVMTRRVMPMFIQNGVEYPVKLINRNWLDKFSLVLFIVYWLTDLFAPATLLPDTIIQSLALKGQITALLAIMLFVLHSIRLFGWYTPGIWNKPLLWILFLAYASMTFAFALKALSWFFNLPPSLAIHAFTIGGIGMITIGMMARVALGHTGRNVFDPPRILFWMFILLFLGAVFRVILPLLTTSYYSLWIGLSQVLWITSFLMFFFTYFSVLIRQRPDGAPG